MELLQKNVQRAKANKQRIVLPEGLEPRTLQAADRILADGIAHIILLGNPAEIQAKAAELGLKHIDQAEIIDPQNHARREAYRDLLMELRKSKGMTREQADELVVNPLYLACLMIKSGDADGEVAGAHNTTGNVLRPALQLIKTRPGLKVVSGAFLIFSPLKEYGENGFFIFADCAVTPNPDSNELAQIAIASADTARSIGDMEPRVALLSYSTKGSAKSEMIDKVTEAYKIAKEMAPDLLIDGELQADA
ncbi:phosphate acyltransferase, partial [uncultured Porphyromonas sp.]